MLANLVLKNIFIDIVISSFQARGIFECLTSCFWSENCVSFMFHRGTNTCHFCQVIFNGDQSLTSPQLDMRYYEFVHTMDKTYEAIINGYYKIHPQRITWDQARGVCQSEGGDLATPTTQSQLQFYRNILFPVMFSADVFVGGKKVSGQWKWLDGSDVTGVNIVVTNPAVNHCLEFNGIDGIIYSESCNSATHAFVCEY